MMLISFFIHVLLSNFVFANVNNRKSGKAKACERELEKIAYYPDNCAFAYLKRITNVLRAKSPLFWTPSAQSVIESFEVTYGVQVDVADAFGTYYDYPGGAAYTPEDYGGYNMDEGIARTNVFGESSSIIQVGNTSYVTYYTIFWNQVGEMYYVLVYTTLDKSSVFC